MPPPVIKLTHDSSMNRFYAYYFCSEVFFYYSGKGLGNRCVQN